MKYQALRAIHGDIKPNFYLSLNFTISQLRSPFQRLVLEKGHEENAYLNNYTVKRKEMAHLILLQSSLSVIHSDIST